MILSGLVNVLFLGLLALVPKSLAAGDRCQFPSGWKGKWYQNGLGEVNIRQRLITKKGTCYEHHRDYYLVKKRDENCYQCLLVIKRHENILQYKESYCLARDSLRNICATIQVEKPLYTLVRDPAIPTKCPFKDAYYFDYNDQASGFCDTPISYAKPCAGFTKYKLHFEHCKPYAMFSNSDLDYECIATWKDGSETYMYGKFAGPGIANKDESYRCFKYQYYGTEMSMSMSVGATCQGLRSPHDGPVTMQFTKDIFGWPPPSCQYPDWLSGITWRDIEGKHTISFEPDSRVMTGYYRRRVTSDAEVQSEHRCVEVMEDKQTDEGDIATVFSFTTHNCMSKHQCLRFKRSKEGKLEFYKGRMADHESGRECLEADAYEEPEIWMAENAGPVACPMGGGYLMQDDLGCQRRISIGCVNRTLLTFGTTCHDVQAVPAFSLQCLLTWHDSGRTYLLAKEPGVDSRVVNCFRFKERQGNLHLTTDRKCDGGASGLLGKSSQYQLQKETCQEAMEHMILPEPPTPPVDVIPAETTTKADEYSDADIDARGGHEDDYDDIDFRYAEEYDRYGHSDPQPQPLPESKPDVTQFPPLSHIPAVDGAHRDDVFGDRQNDRGMNDDTEPDEGSWLTDGLSDYGNRDRHHEKEKPYPKYSQVDQSHKVSPTGVAGREQFTGTAYVTKCPNVLLLLVISLVVYSYR